MGMLNSIKGLELIQVSNLDNLNENYFVEYLDYVDVVKDIKLGGKPSNLAESVYVDNLLEDGFIDPQTHQSLIDGGMSREVETPMVSLSLVVKKVLVEFKDEHVAINPGEDPSQAVYSHLLKLTVSKMRELATESAKSFEKNEGKSLDYKITDEDTGDIVRRKFISKVIRSSSAIAVRTRRGPGNFVIAKKEYIDLMSSAPSSVYLYPLEVTSISNIRMFVCDDLGDEVIVGRLGSTEEPGIRFISNDDALEKNLTFNDTDISGINIRYALGAFTPNDNLNYISFKFEK